MRDLRKRVIEQKRLKERRRRQQEANVLRKKEEREQHRCGCVRVCVGVCVCVWVCGCVCGCVGVCGACGIVFNFIVNCRQRCLAGQEGSKEEEDGQLVPL